MFSTYQAASGAGLLPWQSWIKQYEEILKDEPLPESLLSMAYNLIPQVDVFTGITVMPKEEMKMYHEHVKSCSDIEVSATCVRVPVMRSF